MSATLPLDELVQAICDGLLVDWQTLEQNATPTDRQTIRALRVLEGVARVHGPSATPPDDSRPSASSATGADALRWGHLEILEPIASGAFGDVFKAWDSGLDREVALKILRRSPDAEAHADEAVEEGRLLARVHHPNVVTVHGAARHDGRAGVWMELLRGQTLATRIADNGPLDPAPAAAVGAAVADALGAVHAAGLVHRDVKAQNVMLAEDGRVVLMDLGAGESMRHSGISHAGTPLYLAPEVAAGAPATPQSDIFSLGVLLRFLVTGHFEAGRVWRVDATRSRLLAIADRASAADATHRYPSADACANALRASGSVGERRYRFSVAAASLTLALLAVFSWSLGTRHEWFETAWRGAIARPAPIPADVLESSRFSSFGPRGEVVVVRTQDDRLGIDALRVVGGETMTWWQSTPAEGHPEFTALAPDGREMLYVWVDEASRRASLRVADRDGRTRTVFEHPDLRGAFIGVWTEHGAPAVLSFERGELRLAIVERPGGGIVTIRNVEREPLSLALSPDGDYLAFDQPRGGAGMRDLVIRNLADQAEWPLFADPHRRTAPVWSPDGSRLFYLQHDGDSSGLWSVRLARGRASGAPVRVRDDVLAGAVPLNVGFLGDSLAVWLARGIEPLYLARSEDGQTFSELSATPQLLGASPAWSRDGRLAWVGNRGALTVRTSDGASRQFSGPLEGAYGPKWSPDGASIAVWSIDRFQSRLVLWDIRDGSVSELYRRAGPHFTPWWGLAWAPNGREVFCALGPDRLEAIDTSSRARRSFYRPPAGWAIEVSPIDVSPDQHSLLLVETNGQGHELVVIRLDASGLSKRVPLPASAGVVGWHPDGRSVVAVRATEGSLQHELWQLPLDGSAHRSLGLRSRGMTYPAMSRDGREVAYVPGSTTPELWLLTPRRSESPVGRTFNDAPP